MTEEIRIPRTRNALIGALNGIEQVLMLRKWGRACILSAWAHNAQGRRTDLSRNGEKLSYTEIAALGIPGLTKPETVASYCSAWAQGVEEGYCKEVRPGQLVQLPDPKVHPFPPVVSEGDPRYLAITDRDALRAQAVADGTGPAKVEDIAKNLKAMGAAIVGSPRVAAAAEAALARRPITKQEAEVTLERVARAHPDVVERRGVGIREDRNRQAFEEIRQERVASGEPTTQALDLLAQRDIGAEGFSLLHQIKIRFRALGLLREEATSEDCELVLESFQDVQAFAEHVLEIWRRPNSDLDAEFRQLREEMRDDQIEP